MHKDRVHAGGQAYPRSGFYPPSDGDIRDWMPTVTEPHAGMTLLDYYVGQALVGMLANPTTRTNEPGPIEQAKARAFVEGIAVAAFTYAAAVIEYREKYLSLPPKKDAQDES